MYAWLWHRLPGGLPGKIAGSLVLLVLAGFLLFQFAFPWAERQLPYNDVTVNNGGTPATSASPSPSATP